MLRFEPVFYKGEVMFSSRWGFHPCDYQTYRKLKFLNQIYLHALRLAHSWQRWHRKDPHNRVSRRRIKNDKGQTIGYDLRVPLPEPRICPIFSQKVLEVRHVDKKGNFFQDGFMEEKVITDDLWIPADYAAARKPAADPAAVPSLHHSAAEIEELCRKARTWLEEQDMQ
jgi:hypothetical protein